MGKGTAPFGHSCPAQKGRLEREKGTVDRKGRESQLREKKGLSHHDLFPFICLNLRFACLRSLDGKNGRLFKRFLFSPPSEIKDKEREQIQGLPAT